MARLLSARTLVLGGLAVAATAAALKNRKKVAGLIGARSGGAPEPYAAPSSAPVGVPAQERDQPMPPPELSNVDVSGPPANTATPVPAPEPQMPPAVDEEAEERAAAAEAANIGGAEPEYAGMEPGEPADEALRPLEEAGEGESEGQEQAEADLADNAEVTAGDPNEAERQIEDVIEAQEDPFVGETAEPIVEEGREEEPGGPSGETPAAEKSANVWKPDAAAPPEPDTLVTQADPPVTPDDQPTVEQPRIEQPGAPDGSGWQTWSGRAIPEP
jgi:hypothetical protein